MKPQEFDYDDRNEHVLLLDEAGQAALWLRHDGDSYSLNDCIAPTPVFTDEDIEPLVIEWKNAVEWDD